MDRIINVQENAAGSLKKLRKNVNRVYRSIFDCVIVKFILKCFQQGFVFATLLAKWTKDHWIQFFRPLCDKKMANLFSGNAMRFSVGKLFSLWSKNEKETVPLRYK